YEDGAGFRADLERMANAGWGIEVLSWDICCNKKLREWAKATGVYIPLENYYESVTFLEGTRFAKAVSLRHRQLANPHPA
ncbi:MAG TPA: hypothetical protein VLJ61_00670, partial [Pyrinomonadaceae bacterium]|nr:hypothetical protein [Pyrinomonadaceae bacterium]